MFVILDQPIERVNEAAAVEISGTSRATSGQSRLISTLGEDGRDLSRHQGGLVARARRPQAADRREYLRVPESTREYPESTPRLPEITRDVPSTSSCRQAALPAPPRSTEIHRDPPRSHLALPTGGSAEAASPGRLESTRGEREESERSERACHASRLPAGGYQRVEPDPDDAARLRVWVDLMAPQDATPEELSETDFRSPSAMIDSSDEVIIELSHKARGAERSREDPRSR